MALFRKKDGNAAAEALPGRGDTGDGAARGSGSQLILAHSPEIPALLHDLDITLAITTYQAGKLIFVSATDDGSLVQLPRSFDRAMALATHGERLLLSTRETVEIYASEPRLAADYPRQPSTYDTIFLPRLSYNTGPIGCHGIAWGGDRYWIVNTRYSCLASLSPEASFAFEWKPPFISQIVFEDRCHLNGMAMDGPRPRFVTTLGTGDSRLQWKETLPRGGTVIDVASGEIVAAELPIPHSPRMVEGNLLLLFSGTGELAALDPATGHYEVIQRLNRFVRGMVYHGGYLFVAANKIRPDSSSFGKLDIAEVSDQAGVFVIELESGRLAGALVYQEGVEEIFDLEVLPGLRRPGILPAGEDSDEQKRPVVWGEGAAWVDPVASRSINSRSK
ncbi:MAG: TIGR03032 family protein [Spirochaetaceae bacterium]